MTVIAFMVSNIINIKNSFDMEDVGWNDYFIRKYG